MRQSTRLIVNVLSTLVRTPITFVIGLIVVRLLVGTLGIADYGLLGALGGTAVMLNLLSGVLTGTSQRHLAVEIGRQDREKLQVVFNTSLALFVALSLLLLVVGLSIGSWLLSILPIPPARAEAAFWVYGLVLTGLAVTTALTPFRAMLTAHEALVVLDVVAFVAALLHLLVVVVLQSIPGDKLVAYAALMLPVQCLLPLAVGVLCLVRYPDSRPRRGRFSLPMLRRIASFAGWLSLHRLGLQLRLQGGLLLIFFFFGGVVSGSYSLALVLARYRQNLARAILRPAGPAMAAMVGRGDLSSLRRLVLVADKYAAIGTLYFVVPVLLETELIFRLWLPRTIPATTALLVRLILIWMSIKVLTRGHGMAMIALGRLAGFVIPVLLLSFGTLVLAAVGFHAFDLGPWVLPATAIGTNILINLFIVRHVGWRIDLSYWQWWRESVFPSLCVMVVAGVPAWSLRWVMPPDWQRLVCVLVVYAVIATAVAWSFAMHEWERAHIRRVLASGVRIVLSRSDRIE